MATRSISAHTAEAVSELCRYGTMDQDRLVPQEFDLSYELDEFRIVSYPQYLRRFRLCWTGQWRQRYRLGWCRPVAFQIAWLEECRDADGFDYAQWTWQGCQTVTVWEIADGSFMATT